MGESTVFLNKQSCRRWNEGRTFLIGNLHSCIRQTLLAFIFGHPLFKWQCLLVFDLL
jgi:hypothetical protein